MHQLQALTDLVKESGIMALQERLLQEEQVEIPTLEFITNGLYTREIIIPEGTVAVSRVWKEPYVDIMISGDITVVTPEGTNRYKGYNLFVGTPGRKRAGYAHKDTLWVTVHSTQETDHIGLIEFSRNWSHDQLSVIGYLNYESLR
jgi:hypothetical protein